jgi:hypothetical protein
MNILRTLAIVTTLVAASALCAAQDPVIDDDVAPPPLKILSQSEKDRLAGETEVKRRTKLGLEMMEVRLKQAETLHSAENFDQMFVELGAFHGLMDNMLEFLDKSERDSKKVIYNFKRFEIGLRNFTPRLELMRRSLPIRYERYVRNLIKNLRNARAKAIEPLFDDTVVPGAKKPDPSQL